MSRLTGFMLGGAFALIAASSAFANPYDDCNSQAPDRVVRGCTAIIEHEVASESTLSVVYTRRGIARARMGAYDAAIADFDEAIRHNPKNPDPLYQRAWVRTKKAEIAKTKDGLAEAITDLTAAIAIKANPLFLAERGAAYARIGDDASAIVDYTQAIGKAPRYALAYYDRAISFAKRKNFSADDYQEALRLDPKLETVARPDTMPIRYFAQWPHVSAAAAH